MIQLTARCEGRAQPSPQGRLQSSSQDQIHKHVEVWPAAAAVHTCAPVKQQLQSSLDTSAQKSATLINHMSNPLELSLSWLLFIGGLNP